MNETSMPTAFPGVPKPPAQQHIKMEPWDSDELYQLTSELICQAEYEIQTDTAGRGEPPSHPNLGSCPDIVKQETDEVGCFPDMVKQGPDEALWFPDIVKQGPDEVGRCPDIVNLGPKGAGSCPCIVKVEPGEFGWCPDIVKLGPKGAGSCPCVVKVEPDEVGWCPDIVKVEPEEVGCCPDIVKQEPDERRHGVEECDPLAPGPSRCDTEQGNTRLSHPAMQLSGGQDCVAGSRRHCSHLVSERDRLKLDLRRAKGEIDRLRSQLADCQRRLGAQGSAIRSLKLKLAGLERSNLEREMVRRKARDILKTVFSENQITSLLDGRRGIVWRNDEMAQAVALRFISKRAYVYLRNKLNYPLPSVAALKKWSSQ